MNEPPFDLYIHHHLGLGDMIHCNGLIRYLLKHADGCKTINTFSKNCYVGMTEWMYRDNPKINVIGINENAHERMQVDMHMAKILSENPNAKFLRVGHEFYKDGSDENGGLSCDMIFYNQVNIPFSARLDYCHWNRDHDEEERVFKKLVPEGEDYIFIHDDPNRREQVGGFVIPESSHRTDLKIVRNDMSESIFHLGKVLTHAKEVHLMESSIRCMAEFLKPEFDENKVGMFFHNFRGGPQYNPETKKWNGTFIDWNLVTR